MTVVSTVNSGTATAYSNQRKIDRCQNGVLWTWWWDGGADFLGAHSTDDGATWTLAGGLTPFAGTGTTYTPNFSVFIDLDDYANLIYKDRHDGYTYYRRGTPNATRTAWTWSAAVQVYGSIHGDYPDIVAFRDGAGWSAYWVASYANTTATPYSNNVVGGPIAISSTGTITPGAAIAIVPNYANGLATWPSIDFNHTGDGKTVANSPDLYVALSAGATGVGFGIRFRKATYSGGAWTWGTEQEIDSTRYISGQTTWLNCLFDGTRVIIPSVLYDGTNVDVMLYERDAADTTTTTWILIDNVSTAETLLNGSSTYDKYGNVYLFGNNIDESSGFRDAVYRKWVRASNSLLQPEVVLNVEVSDSWFSALRSSTDKLVEVVYTDENPMFGAPPYEVAYESFVATQSENLFPDAVIEQTNLKGTLSTIQQDPAAAEYTAMQTIEWTLPTALQVGFPGLSEAGKLYGTQTIGIDVGLDYQMGLLRTTEDGARAVTSLTASAYLYEDGVNRGLLEQWTMSDNDVGLGVRYFNWDASLLSNPNPDSVEFRLEITADPNGGIAPLIYAVMMTSNYIPPIAGASVMNAVAGTSVASTVISSGQSNMGASTGAVIDATREVFGGVEPVISRANISIDEYIEHFAASSISSTARMNTSPVQYSGNIPMDATANIDIYETINYLQAINIAATGQTDINSVATANGSTSMQGYFHIVVQGHYFTPGLIRIDVVDSSRPTVLSEKLDTLMLNWSVSQATGSRELVDE